MEKKSSRNMPRDERLKITAIHEIGHYLLIKKYNKLFPDYPIFTYRIRIFPNVDSNKNGEVSYVFTDQDSLFLNSEELEELININLAGFIAPTIFYNISYNNLYEQTDYITAYNIAEVLSQRFNEEEENKKNRISMSSNEIIKKHELLVKQYLEDNKELLQFLSELLLKSKELTFIDLKKIDEKYNL